MEAPAPKSSGSYQVTRTQYTDYSRVPVYATFEDIRRMNPSVRLPSGESGSEDTVRRRGPSQSFVFPTKLYEILSRPDLSHIITWMTHGRSWRVIDRQAFTEQVMPKYFAQTKYPSFIRQVNGWGFRRITQGEDQNSYYCDFFLRTKEHLVKFMTRHAAARQGSESEPNFREYPFLPPNAPLHIKSPTTKQTERHNGPGYAHAHCTRKTGASYDGQNYSQEVQSAPGPAAATMNARGFPPQAAYHHYHHQGYANSGPGHQGSHSNYYPSGPSGRHQHPWSENGNSSFANCRKSDNMSPSVPDLSHSSTPNEETNGHRQNSTSNYSRGSLVHFEHNGVGGYPSHTSSDRAQIASHVTNVSQENHQRAQMGLGENFRGAYHQESSTNRGNMGTYNAYWPAQNREAHGETYHGFSNPGEVLSFQPFSAFSSADVSEGNDWVQEQQANASESFPDRSDSEPMSRPPSSIGDDWDDGFAAKLSCQLDRGN